MGVSLSTARWLAPLSFAVDFAAQNYGMFSTPNMKDIHDANLSFFSPQPFFIAAFFFPQQICQLVWLLKLWRTKDKTPATNKTDTLHVESMIDFVPYYALGNFCIATWMIFWNNSALKAANVFVTINSVAQLYYISRRLPPMEPSSSTSVLTHVVSKTFAGIGVLDLLHNTSVAVANGGRHPAAPSTVVMALTGLGFAGTAAASDWIFGGCLVYDLVALAVGQRAYGNESWSNVLAAFAVGTGAIVAAKNLIR